MGTQPLRSHRYITSGPVPSGLERQEKRGIDWPRGVSIRQMRHGFGQDFFGISEGNMSYRHRGMPPLAISWLLECDSGGSLLLPLVSGNCVLNVRFDEREQLSF
jgi:hypothetical protein